jgi:hypothetical protein
MFTAKHGACASPQPFWPRLNAPPLAVWPMLGRQVGRPFATRHGIPVGRGRNRFSFRRRFLCSLSPRLCVRLLSLGRHVIHNFRRCDPLCVPVFRCISLCRREAPPLSRPPDSIVESECMLNPSQPVERRIGRGRVALCGVRPRALEAYIRSGASRTDHYCLMIQSSTSFRAASLVRP